MSLIRTRLHLSGQLRVPVLLQKGKASITQNNHFLTVQWLLNSKKEPLYFSAGEQEMIMNAYEEYKSIIMAKSNTATAARARQEAVYGAISMYVYIMTSVRVVLWVEESLSKPYLQLTIPTKLLCTNTLLCCLCK